jgi:hypothetical protein
VPENPTNLRENIATKNTTSIDVVWDEPTNGVHQKYYIKWFKDGLSENHDTLAETSKTLSALEPGQNYNVSVYTVSNGVNSSGISKIFTTSK